MLFGRGNIPKIRYFIDQIEDETERRRSWARLNEMVNYAGVEALRAIEPVVHHQSGNVQ